MPPRRGIVKSGNAGNSSKPAKATSIASVDPSKPPPLFPPGSKYPLSLLQEKCQKLGWERPVVDTRQHGSDFTFVVTLSKFNNRKSEMETVRMQPQPPYYRPTAIEARHWGATYALYRFCNGIQLNRVLPPGPRDYWNELANEHKAIPEHKKWMYDADPFSAKKRLEAQAAARQTRESQASIEDPARHRPSTSTLQSSYPEVLMATSLRELVEDSIKQGLALYPGTMDLLPMTLSPDSVVQLDEQLRHLGFNKNQVSNVTKFFSEESSLSSSLLNILPPLEACIEYLILHTPECDLPQRFLPSNNSSNPFITAAYSGPADIKRRWIEEKAVKEAGWPANIVKDCTADEKCIERLDFLMVTLGRKLRGQVLEESLNTPNEAAFYDIKEDEFEAMGGSIVEPDHLELPLFSAPVSVHILFSNNEYYPRPGYIPVYLTSSTIPAYVRLHLLSRFLQTMDAYPELEVGEGFCMAVMRIIEAEWAAVEDNGPPDMSVVLKHVIVPRQVTLFIKRDKLAKNPSSVVRPIRKPIRVGTDAELKKKLQVMQQNDKYQGLLHARSRLPAFVAKNEFLDLLEKHSVVVVVGETGCGKTTQLPQFILDSLILSNRGSQASIIVTQPRRLSAVSVATRISEERLNDGSVGYSIRGETKASKNTQLLFCTTGVVLRRLSTGDNLEDVSHVVVDEVHERSIDGDFLLLQLKDLLRKHPHLKVVLMSATINHETFVKYFDGAPLLKIPGFTHPVTDKYLEDLLPKIDYRPKDAKSTQGEDLITLKEFQDAGLGEDVVNALRTLSRSDKIDYQLIASLVSHIVKTEARSGGILIFLPGVIEIKQCMEAVRKTVDQNGVLVLPLHANLSINEQQKVFKSTRSWKVIAATNVAETSITIDDVIYVIDAGKVKETRYDPETNLSRLVEVWVTRAAARQRRGRAGRTQPGVCYKLYTKQQQARFPEFPIPEILRVPLENILLTIKASKENQDVKAFLSQAVDAPSMTSMDRALRTLEEIGAINEDGKLTALGRHVSLLPMDVRLAKMLILATIFQCLGPIVTVVALLSSKSLFIAPMDRREEAAAARAGFFTGDSDLLTDVKAFDDCMKMYSEGRTQAAIGKFCENNFISTTTLREVMTLRQDFVSALSDMGFIPVDSMPSTPDLNDCSTNLNLVKSVILGGLWPRVARIHLPKEKIKFDKVAAGTVERENAAKDFKIYDLQEGRVFLHPGSLLFNMTNWKPPFLVYFLKYETSKIFLRDASKVPIYALLLFGGTVSVDHIRGSLTVGRTDNFIKLRAIPRIGILVNQLRRLLDSQLQSCIEDGKMLTGSTSHPITHAILALLTHDGRTE